MSLIRFFNISLKDFTTFPENAIFILLKEKLLFMLQNAHFVLIKPIFQSLKINH